MYLHIKSVLRFCIIFTCVVNMSVTESAYANEAHANDAPANDTTIKTLILAGGCFWGVEAVFEHTKGITDVVSGYAGGDASSATYNSVSKGKTKHAEAVKISYDPKQISLATLLDIYFTVAHNPTQLNYQGPDHGFQYRSAVFYQNAEQKTMAEEKIATMETAKIFPKPIVTTLEPLGIFYPAEEEHQDFARNNPKHPYIVMHDAPKVHALSTQFPELFTE